MPAPNKTVLIVDDEYAISEALAALLEIEGYRVLTASNGREALDLLKDEHPDLIVMDIMMPVLDGLETARRIRDDAHLDDIPLILMSAAAPPPPPELGVSRFIRKPQPPSIFVETVAEALDHAGDNGA